MDILRIDLQLFISKVDKSTDYRITVIRAHHTEVLQKHRHCNTSLHFVLEKITSKFLWNNTPHNLWEITLLTSGTETHCFQKRKRDVNNITIPLQDDANWRPRLDLFTYSSNKNYILWYYTAGRENVCNIKNEPYQLVGLHL